MEAPKLESPSQLNSRELPTNEIYLDVYSASRGIYSDHNEDNHFFNIENASFGVFDGMGGENNGIESSKFCRDLIEQELKSFPNNLSLKKSEEKLNEISKYVIKNFPESTKEHNLGGSTGTFGIICIDKEGNQSLVGNSLGDSRAYLFRPSNIKKPLLRLTSDDTMVRQYSDSISQFEKTQDKLDELLSSDNLSERELILHENRNAISNYFGYPDAKPEVFFIDFEPGDILLLTTDGIHDNLTTSEINQILSTNQSSEQITKNLINKSYDRSKSNHFRKKKDDMTAIVLKIKK